tara:strand:- start:1278 stop:1880 length:603 start_codon:yes stop_codon:yes gene_type:complete
MEIKNVVGDLFSLLPVEEPTTKVIPHVCNNIGAWGSGFVVAVSNQWPMTEVGDVSPEGSYLKWHRDGAYSQHVHTNEQSVPFALGHNQWIHVDDRLLEADGAKKPSSTYVVNMIGQHETVRTNRKPISYEALTRCMANVRDRCIYHKSLQGKWHNCPMEIHAPKFGSDRAGGTWDFIEELIDELWLAHDIPVTIYEYKGA